MPLVVRGLPAEPPSAFVSDAEKRLGTVLLDTDSRETVQFISVMD
jgi:hypothetical protein